jgi:CheY-like chemotaxis protein
MLILGVPSTEVNKSILSLSGATVQLTIGARRPSWLHRNIRRRQSEDRREMRMFVVVVAEDDPLIRVVLADLLTDEGFEVLEAGHAADAIAIMEYQAKCVDVLFTDVQMPGDMDGVALSHHVKTHWPWIGLLVTSAHARLTEEDLPAGSRFLPKPYQDRHVVQHVRELAEAA